jgi:cytochrome c
MKTKRSLLVAGIAVLCLTAFAFAGSEPSVEGGEKLFNDSALGTSGKSCASCHPDGKGMAAAAGRTEWKLGGNTFTALEDVVNTCLTGPLKGKALDAKSVEMQSIVQYIKSFDGKASADEEE